MSSSRFSTLLLEPFPSISFQARSLYFNERFPPNVRGELSSNTCGSGGSFPGGDERKVKPECGVAGSHHDHFLSRGAENKSSVSKLRKFVPRYRLEPLVYGKNLRNTRKTETQSYFVCC